MPLQRAGGVLLAACRDAAFGDAEQFLGVWGFCLPEKKKSPVDINDSENLVAAASCFHFLGQQRTLRLPVLHGCIHLLESPTKRYSLHISAQLIWEEQAYVTIAMIVIIFV